MEKPVVAIARCGTYAPGEIEAAVDSVLGSLGGIEKFARPGQRVFVKPNLLMAAEPGRACTTHPEVMIAIIRRLLDSGARVSFGDLPGGFHVGGTRKIQEVTDMLRVAKVTGAELVTLEKHGFRKLEIPGAKRLGQIHVPKYLDRVDAIVNVCKLKTHMQTLMTGAVKNMFGMATSQDRMRAHRMSRYMDFAEAVVDIFSVLPPVLNMMDAVVGMEGTGPSQGRPVRLGFIAGSADAVALDAAAAVAMGFEPREIGTIEAARRRGLGAGRLKDIDIAGEPLDGLKKKVRRPSSAVFLLLPALAAPFNELTKVKPVIISGKCKKCNKCAEVCPGNAIRFTSKTGIIDDRKCILCFCCHEMCPHDAVGLKKPPLVRILESIRAD